MKQFLAFPLKRTPLNPGLSVKINEYIDEHFKDTHPDAFQDDIAKLSALRREWLEGDRGPEVHQSVVNGLFLYHAQIAFLLTKFPSNIGLTISYHLPFPPLFSFQNDPVISLSSFNFERAGVLYNIAALHAGLAAGENRGETDGIKRALIALQFAAGTFKYLRTVVLQALELDVATAYDLSAPINAGYDMTGAFIETMETLCLAQAQECFWQRALMEKYTHSVVAKLAMKVSEYYDIASKQARSGTAPTINNFPQSWSAHLIIKKAYFEAVAHYRMSQDDLAKQRYGEEIARLKQAEASLKQAATELKRSSSSAIASDVKALQDVITSNLSRAIRDNDIIYVSPIPSATQLAVIVSAGMVKATVPAPIENSLEWIVSQPGGALFSTLVPYGVHLALSLYDDRKDSLIRTLLEQKQDDLDATAATTLQSYGLPGSITALERPSGLPPTLLKKAEEVFVSGGLPKVQHLLQEVVTASQANSSALEQALDTLDQDTIEEEQMLNQHPELLGRMPGSSEANRHWLHQAESYRETLQQARKSDSNVRSKWDQWAPLINLLAGGESALLKHIPTSGRNVDSDAELPISARALQKLLEDLDDSRSRRARLVAEGKRMAAKDDIRSTIIQESAKLANGGAGNVKPEWFEETFEKELRKYHRLIDEMQGLEDQQARLLDAVKERNQSFLQERQDDSRVKFREQKLQEMELAYWKWREIIGNCEEGLKFYTGFAALLSRFKDGIQSWTYNRRTQMNMLLAEVRDQDARFDKEGSPRSVPEAKPIAPLPEPIYVKPPTLPATSRFTLPPPSSSGWESAEDFLPPPPTSQATSSRRTPEEIARYAEQSMPVASPRRVTRSTASQPAPASTSKPPRKKGGMAV